MGCVFSFLLELRQQSLALFKVGGTAAGYLGLLPREGEEVLEGLGLAAAELRHDVGRDAGCFIDGAVAAVVAPDEGAYLPVLGLVKDEVGWLAGCAYEEFVNLVGGQEFGRSLSSVCSAGSSSAGTWASAWAGMRSHSSMTARASLMAAVTSSRLGL